MCFERSFLGLYNQLLVGDLALFQRLRAANEADMAIGGAGVVVRRDWDSGMAVLGRRGRLSAGQESLDDYPLSPAPLTSQTHTCNSTRYRDRPHIASYTQLVSHDGQCFPRPSPALYRHQPCQRPASPHKQGVQAQQVLSAITVHIAGVWNGFRFRLEIDETAEDPAELSPL